MSEPMGYSVYRARYKTVRGTWRDYIGYTPALDLRLWWHKNKPPAWMRCRGGQIALSVLESGLVTKAEALACEALHAARAVARAPLVARGGLFGFTNNGVVFRPSFLGRKMDAELGSARALRIVCC